MQRRSLYFTALLLSVTNASCSAPTCGAGTTLFTKENGTSECRANVVAMLMCDPATTIPQAGLCVADPAKFPKCGPGTMLDAPSMSCLPTAGNCGPVLKPCPPMPNRFSLSGIISHLKDGAFADKEMVEVRVYDPLAFLSNPNGTMPQKTLVTSDSTYCFNDLVDMSGMGLIAVAVTDPGGPTNWALAGVGAQNVKPDASFRADAFIVEKALVASWDVQAGLSGMNTFEMGGAYVGRFVDTPVGVDDGAKPVSGVVLQMGGMDAPETFYFKTDLGTIDKALTATESTTGAVVQHTSPAALSTYSGKGGMVNNMPAMWETVPGASTSGVVFVQKFHVK